MKNLTIKLIAAMTLTAAAGATFAAEVPASFDPKKCAVEYPKASLMNEEQGTTSASFLVGADGTVSESKLEKSSGFKNLDKAAQKDLGACKFKNGVKDGKPVDGVATVDWVWKLD